MRKLGWSMGALFAAAAVATSMAARADVVLPLGDTVTATGTGGSQTYSVSGSNAVTGPISPTVTYDIASAFNETVGAVTYPSTSANFNAYSAGTYPQGANGSGGPWNFQDTYFFTTAASATVQTAVISGGLSNVSDLQVRLVEVSTGAAPSSSTPWLGPIAGAITVVDSWQTFNLPGGGSFNETLPTGFAASTPGTVYALQVRGEAVGNGAASYSGTIGFQSVPLPASGWLLLSGLGAFGFIARRRAG